MHYIARQLSYFDKQDGRVVVPEAALGRQPLPLVVLGDPGMGKSDLLRQLSQTRGYTYLTAAQFLRRPLAESPAGVLLLDGLDEVNAGKDHDPLDRLLTRLGEAGWPDFVLSCRAADWRGSGRAQSIADDYARPVRVLTLEPLTERESLSLLEAELGTLESREFHAALHQHRLDGLLANPQSLKMLIEVADGGIPTSRADLFERAARKMIAEHNDRHVQSALNQLNSDEALDAAGAAMAMLLLTGKEGLFNGLQADTPPPLLHIAEITTLPFAAQAATALHARLFRTIGEADSFKDCHRTVAEYLGARWLGRVVETSTNPPRLVKRLLALLHAGDRVPASLRGLHAWLACASHHLATPVVAADPYGVLRYGDLGEMSATSAERVWDSFARHGREDPWFRAGDWQRFSVAGLVQKGLGQKLAGLLNDSNSSFHLRSLVLDLLREGECVPEMRDTLLAIVADPDRTYSERHDAVDILAAWPDNGVDWPELFARLCASGDIDAPRLADEAFARIGLAQFSDEALAAIVFARYVDTSAGSKRRRTSRSDDYWWLAQCVSLERCAGLLDALAKQFGPERPSTELIEHDSGYGHLVWTLLARQIPSGIQDPIRLWRWLDSFAGCHTSEPRPRAVVSAWLSGNTSLRQTIHAQIFLTPEGAASRERDRWQLGGLSTGLYLQEEDVIELLGRLIREDRRDALARNLFETLVCGWSRSSGWTPAIAALAEIYAAADPALLATLYPPPRQESEKTLKMMAKFAAEERARERKWEARKLADRNTALAEREALSRGEGVAAPFALCFLGYGEFCSRDSPPEDRIAAWVGDDLSEDAIRGFEASLHRPLGVPLHEIARRVLEDDDSDNEIWPVVAGLARRHREGRGFQDLDEDHLLAGLIAKRIALNIVDKHMEGFGEALETYAVADEARFERYLRAMIEPQLNSERHSISGMHYTLGGKTHQGLRAQLLLEWFDVFAGCFASDREALVDALLDLPQPYAEEAGRRVDQLIAAAPPRACGEDRTAYWTALRILRGFDGARDLLESAAEDAEFLWSLQKATGHHRFDTGRIRAMPPERLVWIFERFEARWPEVDRPRGMTNGSRNPWDASDFLRAVLFRIADDTSQEAMRLLHVLTERGSTTYGESLRAARARQRGKAAESDYVPHGLAALAAVIEEEPPQVPADIRAIALDAIADLQARIAGASTDTADLFYDGAKPKNEERCRNALLDLLGPTLPFGITWAPEEQMPSNKRADAGFRLGAMRVPLEAKLAWNSSLWTACSAQLDRLYASADYMAGGQGIYLVFWFGSLQQAGYQVPVSPQGVRPNSPEELATMLHAQLFAGAGDRLSIVVLDVERLSGRQIRA